MEVDDQKNTDVGSIYEEDALGCIIKIEKREKNTYILGDGHLVHQKHTPKECVL